MNDLFEYATVIRGIFMELEIGSVPSNDSYPCRADISAIGWFNEVLPD